MRVICGCKEKRGVVLVFAYLARFLRTKATAATIMIITMAAIA